MKSLFLTLCRLSQLPERMINGRMSYEISIDLNKKEISFGDYALIHEGKLTDKQVLLDNGSIPFDILIDKHDLSENPEIKIDDLTKNPYENIEKLYEIFYNSAPDKLSTERKQNFIGKSLKEFKACDFTGMERSRIQTLLELYVLLGAMRGWFPWDDSTKFFRKGTHPNLYIYKAWIL